MTATEPVTGLDTRRVLEAARGGHGQLILLTGAAGAGKTRRARAIERVAREAGFTTVWSIGGRPGAPAYWPWLGVLRALPADVRAEHPTAGRLLDSAQTGVADLRARFELFEDVAALIADAAHRTPLLITVDDLHEADAASLLLLAHLAAHVHTMPIVAVASVRTDLEPERAEWPQAWAETVRHGRVVPVGPLGTDEIATVLAAATGAADPALVDRIARRTGGNALFVCELARLCAASGGDVEALPDTVRAVIATRLGQRSPACRRVLSVAAAVGTDPPLDLISDVLGDPAEEVLAAVDEAARSGLVEQRQAQRIAFVHEIVRDAIYDALPGAHRAHWHRLIADRHADAGLAAQAAHHYQLAGPASRQAAAEWFLRAGTESMARLGYEQAAEQFAAALESGPPDPGRVHLSLGTALLAAGDPAAARAAHLAAADLARRNGDAELLAAAALGLGTGPTGFEIPLFDRDQVEALERALAWLPEPAIATRAAVLARLSVALTFSATVERRTELATEAVRLARAAGDPATVAIALAAQADVVAGPADVETRLALTSEIVTIAEGLRDSALELLGRRLRVVARFETGDHAGVEEDVRAFKAVADALRQPLYSWYVPLWYAGLALARGELDEAAEQLASAARVGAEAGSANAEALVLTHRFIRAAETGDRDGVRATLDDSSLDVSLGPWAAITISLVEASLGATGAARARLDGSADLLAALPLDSEWLPAVTQAAEAVEILGGHPVARWLYDALLPYGHRYVVEGIGAVPRGSVQRHLGILAALLGEHAAAERHFHLALEANRRIGARLLVARTLLDAAVTLADPTRMAEAQASYAEIGTRPPPFPGAEPPLDDGARPSADDPAPVERDPSGTFCRTGDVWTLEYAGRRVTIRDSKGLRDIAILLANPGRAVAAMELATARAPGTRGAKDPELSLHEPGDLGPVLDEQARQAYRARLRELDEEAADADRTSDVERSARVAAERDALVRELSAAYGLAGRVRRAGSPVERARTTVTARIRDSIRRVEAVHPELGRHLTAAVRTGTLCSYEPERPTRWQLTS